ncbi:hypothetical protein N752_27535 [Desulforamulus aquiferis]|nr:hypothetical protein [Desulforamulus aquiferis]RYD01880.1 hypothetical protein N752_27535 [Desulforamulus aquiferis]
MSRGYEKQLAEKMFDLMEYFAGYGFNKSHSAAYALVSYQTAYLKANYPVEYMAALLTSVRDNTDKVVLYIEECRRMNIQVLPPDINLSRENFTVDDKSIRFGLAAIKNIGWNAVHEFIQARQVDGIFTSFTDFCTRVDTKIANRRVLENLIKSGALDRYGHRAQLLAALDMGIEFAHRAHRDREQGQVNLFDLMPENSRESIAIVLPHVPKLSVKQQLDLEKESMGLYISGHPLSELSWLCEAIDVRRVSELQELTDGLQIFMVVIISSVKRITSRRGDPMAFMSGEDLTGSCEFVVFPEVLKRFGFVLDRKEPLLVIGKLNNSGDEPRCWWRSLGRWKG